MIKYTDNFDVIIIYLILIHTYKNNLYYLEVFSDEYEKLEEKDIIIEKNY